mmetsp:Transcript_30720/g.94916  ORF Transcript_30720/g.94916 Transcript_30720/m.94916 type:complete len:307 (-) Transcript_30720:777-1697(-)
MTWAFTTVASDLKLLTKRRKKSGAILAMFGCVRMCSPTSQMMDDLALGAVTVPLSTRCASFCTICDACVLSELCTTSWRSTTTLSVTTASALCDSSGRMMRITAGVASARVKVIWPRQRTASTTLSMSYERRYERTSLSAVSWFSFVTSRARILSRSCRVAGLSVGARKKSRMYGTKGLARTLRNDWIAMRATKLEPASPSRRSSGLAHVSRSDSGATWKYRAAAPRTTARLSEWNRGFTDWSSRRWSLSMSSVRPRTSTDSSSLSVSVSVSSSELASLSAAFFLFFLAAALRAPILFGSTNSCRA